ncbi:MAG: hypothetical protein ABIC68_06540 [Candidatus Omnitrophota bacterium]
MMEMMFLRPVGTNVSSCPFNVMMPPKIKILLKMIHPAKNMMSFLK